MSEILAAIFDLDQTLVHSGSLDGLRRARKWAEVYQRIPEILAQEGLPELFQRLKDQGIPIAVVTSSPRPYCERMLKHAGYSPDVTVCYHDTKRHKPDPEPLLHALERLKLAPSKKVAAIGDTDADVVAAKNAGLLAIGVTWGIEDERHLTKATPDHVFKEVGELEALLLGTAD